MRGTFLSIFVLACAALPVQAQLPIGFGLKGGGRLTDFTEGNSSVSTSDHTYTIGPYAELNLPAGFSIELDLLYKKSGTTFYNVATDPTTYTKFSMDSFDLPILLKKSFDAQMIFQPFVEAGLANRYSTGIPGTTSVVTPVGTTGGPVYSTSTTSGWQEGIVLGGGVQFKIVKVKFSGELRWTRFGNISASSLPKLNANQAELLVGIGF